MPPTGRCVPKNALKAPKPIIRGVSGTIMPGQFVAIIGASGKYCLPFFQASRPAHLKRTLVAQQRAKCSDTKELKHFAKSHCAVRFSTSVVTQTFSMVLN